MFRDLRKSLFCFGRNYLNSCIYFLLIIRHIFGYLNSIFLSTLIYISISYYYCFICFIQRKAYQLHRSTLLSSTFYKLPHFCPLTFAILLPKFERLSSRKKCITKKCFYYNESTLDSIGFILRNFQTKILYLRKSL